MPISPTLPTPGQSDWDTPLNAALTVIVDEVNAQETDIADKLDTSAAPELIRDTMGTALVAGTNVTITPDDGSDTITIAASIPGGSGDMSASVYDPTNVADDAFSMDNMVEGSTTKILTDAERTKLAGIATGATANDTDANLKNRANHTGTQAQSTVTDLTTDLAAKAPLASPTFTGDPKAPTPSAGDNDTSIATTAFVAGEIATSRARYSGVNAQTGTTYAPVLADEGKLVTLSNASAITVTMPSDATTAFPVGATIDFVGIGAGLVTFSAGSGATVNPTAVTRAQYSAVSAIKRASNTWLIVGDLA